MGKKQEFQNPVYKVKGDPTSGQFQPTDVESAVVFRDRFNAEVGPGKGAGYDSYSNKRGPVRSTTYTRLPVEGLLKNAIMLLDALHGKVAGERTADKNGKLLPDETDAAIAALDILRGVDVAFIAESGKRKDAVDYRKARAAAILSGLDGNAFDAFWKSQGKEIPVASVEVADAVEAENADADAVAA